MRISVLYLYEHILHAGSSMLTNNHDPCATTTAAIGSLCRGSSLLLCCGSCIDAGAELALNTSCCALGNLRGHAAARQLLGVTHSNSCCAHWLESNACAPHLGDTATRNTCKRQRKLSGKPCDRTLQADVRVRSCTHPGRGKTAAEALQTARTGAAAHWQRDL